MSSLTLMIAAAWVIYTLLDSPEVGYGRDECGLYATGLTWGERLVGLAAAGVIIGVPVWWLMS